MKNLKKIGEGQFLFERKKNETYFVSLKNNDTRTIQVFTEDMNPVLMNSDETNVEVWDDVESTMYDYYDKIY